MKLPKDKAIETLAALLKEWRVTGNPTTAAVFALAAVEKALQRPKLKKSTDYEMVKFLEGVIGAVEATRDEQIHLYTLYTKELKAEWIENNSGFLETVGYLDDRPICISLHTATVKGHKILFWHATSQVVDHVQIQEWLMLNVADNRTDATNFHNIFPR